MYLFIFDNSYIWSLGCVIIEMATGQPPWQAQFNEVTAAMFHIASTESPPDFPPNLSPEAHDFLSLCFRRNPKERPHAKTLMKHAFLQYAFFGGEVGERVGYFVTPPSPPPPLFNFYFDFPYVFQEHSLYQYLKRKRG